MTSSPGPISSASSASTSASVPFATPIAWPPPRTSRNRASSSETSGAYCDWTSTSGIVTATHSSGGCPSIHEIRRRQENACHDRVLGVVKAVVEALEARSERVADASEHERPDGAADAEVEQERG